ncbi:PGM2 protein, partial [Jacana jacana]|nr:PGM2 protein [Jacana jacana]
QNPKTSGMVRQVLAEGAAGDLQKYFGSRMEFGTAGLRAAMGAGISHMNDLTIIQTTQGFCRYLEKNFSDLKKRGVVIGFDARAHLSSGGSSKRFARLAANTFISQGVPVYLFSDITPTPFVPYTVTHLKLCAGIMVTASHNPKQDNGYKGGQQVMGGDSTPLLCSGETPPGALCPALEASAQKGHGPVGMGLVEGHKDVQRDGAPLLNINKETDLKFVHTSVHGVGHRFVQLAFKAFDLSPPFAVPEQKDPDPEFPTVKYPNPEEGKGVLTLSFALAEKDGAKIILANDPDADRLAVAEKQESGEWKVFSGNELGALLGWWMFSCWKNNNKGSCALKDVYMLSSTVSSKILRAIALKEGFHFEETLTGFKWMGNRARQLMDQGKAVLFAFEEAIG